MEYFGTNLTEAGHYFWILDRETLRSSKTWFKDIPFNPEELTGKYMGQNLPFGDIVFGYFGEFTVLAISGSCKDTRQGTKSVFWIKEIIPIEEMKQRILDIPIAKKIIDTMPFEIKW